MNLDLILIAQISKRLAQSGWRNRNGMTGGPVFVIERSKHGVGDANQSDVVWALRWLAGER